MFQNDWMVANLANPDFDVDDMVSIGGISTDNTQFLSKDEYLKSSFIRDNDLFKDEDGNFSMSKFDDYYNTQAAKWRDLQENDYPQGLALDPFDTAANRKNAKIKDTKVRVGINYNPDRQQMGIEGFRTISDRTKTQAEIAQSQKIFDYELGEYKDVTPEDSALSVSPIKWIQQLFSEPLVLAQYDEDTIDEYGMEHKKGDYKLNKEGTYYYETLAGRSPLNRSVLSVADILTPENSALNSIDFFDSDDIKKSTAGVVAKTVATVAPMFTPIAPIYYWGIVAKELVKTLPMIHGVVTNLFGDGDNETPEWMNNLAAWGEQATMGTSEYAKKSTFCTENFINLISDVALQWGQQKAITKGISKLLDKGELKNAEKRAFAFYKQKVKEGGRLKGLEAVDETKWKDSILGQMSLKKFYEPAVESMRKKQQLGADLSLVYMALISNTDVYEDMLERGGTKQEAAWIALGSTAGMFSVDKFLHLGELFFDDLTADAVKQSRKVINGEITDALNTFYGKVKGGEKWYKVGFDLGKKAANTFVQNIKDHNLGVMGKALGEGIEEVSEELVTDLSKSTYSLLGDLGLYDKHIEDTGAFDNMLERYGMSFIGGAMGGGLFYGVEKFQGNYNKVQDKDLTDLINDGKADIVRKQVKEMAAKGQIASKTLSGTKYTTSNDGKITWLSTDNDADSQNQQIANRILEKIDAIEAAIVGSKTQMSHDQLFDNMVMQEVRYLQYKNASNVTGYYQEFSKLQSQYIEDYLKYQAALNPTTDTADQTQPTDRQKREGVTDEAKKQKQQQQEEQLQNLKDKVDEDKKKMDEFLSGDTSFDYTRKLLFAMDPYLNKVFMHADWDEWVKTQPAVTTEMEEVERSINWQKHLKDVAAKNLDSSYEAFKKLEKVLAPLLKDNQDNATQFKNAITLLEKISSIKDIGEFIKKNPLVNWDSRLVINGVAESDDEYNNRNNYSTNDEKIKQAKRVEEINRQNDEVFQKFVDQFDKILAPLNYTIDTQSARIIMQNTRQRTKDVVQQKIALYRLINGVLFDPTSYEGILEKFKDDPDNVSAHAQEIIQSMQNRFYSEMASYYNDLSTKIFQGVDIYSQLSPKQVYKNVKSLKNYIESFENINDFISSLNRKDVKNKQQLLNLIDVVSGEIEVLEGELKEMKEGGVPDTVISNALLDDIIDSKIDQEETDSDTWNNVYGKNLTIQQALEQLYNELNSIIPEALRNREVNVREILEKSGIDFSNMTIADFINALQDPNSEVVKVLNNQPITQKIYDNLIAQGNSFKYGNTSNVQLLFGGISMDSAKSLSDAIAKSGEDLITDYVGDLITDIKNNPIYAFQNKLKVTSHSPLEIVLKAINKNIASDDQELFNINYILNQVYKNYIDIEDSSAFELNSTEDEQLSKALQVLDIIQAYIYTATKGPDEKSYFYQNKQINDFRNSHKDKITEKWEDLPVFDQDYGTMLQKEALNMQKEIYFWQALSANNGMNKTRRLANTDKTTSELRYKIIKGINYKFTTDDGTEYALNEGLSALSDKLDDKNYLNSLYQAEKILYQNAQKIISEIGAEQFFTNLWKAIGLDTASVGAQITSKYSEKLKELTPFDQAMYLLSVITSDPNTFYSEVRSFIEANSQIAPFTVQLTPVALGLSALSPTYKIGLRTLYEYSGDYMNLAENCFHIDGVAGAGKTDVIMKAIRRMHQDKEVLVVGPTTAQAIKLQKVLGENTSYVINGNNSIFNHLFTNWNDINQEFNELYQKLENSNNLNQVVSGNYLTLQHSVTKSNERIVNVKFKDNVLKFSNESAPLIFIDEAAYLNKFQILALNEYAKHVGGEVYLANDSNQSGYSNGRLKSLDSAQLFMARTPKQLESMRSANIQKQDNDRKLSQLLDYYQELRITGTVQDLNDFAKKLPSKLKALKLRIYNNDDINGTWLGANIDDAIKKLIDNGKKDAEIGFIGDENSEAYKKLKNAGFTNLSPALSDTVVPGKPLMQGQEFDYVFIDDSIDQSKFPDHWDKQINYLKKFHTLNSRARQGSIFLQSGLDQIFGENRIDSIKSKGFDITSQVPVFRDAYTNQLKAIEFQEDNGETNKSSSTPEEKEQDTRISNMIEYNPDTREEDLKNKETEGHKIVETITQDDTVTLGVSISADVKLLMQANTTWPLTGMQTVMQGKNQVWKANTDFSNPRRNVAALYLENQDLTNYENRKKYQEAVAEIQSAVLHGHVIRNPLLASIGFDLNKGQIKLEIRPASNLDNWSMGTDLKESFITIGGKQYIVSVVLEMPGMKASSDPFDTTTFTGIFDIALLQDPKKLLDEKEQNRLKDILQKRIASNNISSEEKQRAQNLHDNMAEIGRKYTKFLEQVIQDHPEGILLNLDNKYKSRNASYLVERDIPRRLGGNFIPESISVNPDNPIRDSNNFMERNYLYNWSPIYILSPGGADLSESNIGKAVIFATTDRSLDPEKLADLYIEQHNDKDHRTPKIRMIPLGNYGVSFSEFVTHRLADSAGNKQGRDLFRMDVMGLRMYTSMWNFRASLKKFNSELESWEKKYKYSKSKVINITKAEQALFDKYKEEWKSHISEQEAINILNKYKVSEQDIINLETFNTENCKNIRNIRLGHATTSSESYIRSFDVSKSDLYGKSAANMVVISKDTALKYENILDVIFTQVSNSKLGTVLKDSEGNDISEKQYIGNDKGTLTQILHTKHKQLEIDGITIPPEAFFSFFPKTIANIAKSVTSATANTGSNINDISIETIDTANNKETIHLDLSKLLEDSIGLKTKNGKYDKTLFTMFDLIFHGSVQPLHEAHAFAEDAAFKYGMFVDTEASWDNDGKDLNVGTGVNGYKYKLLKTNMHPMFFTINVDLRDAGFDIDLDAIIDEYNTTSPISPTSSTNPTNSVPNGSVTSFYLDAEFNEGETFQEGNETDINKFRKQQLSKILNNPSFENKGYGEFLLRKVYNKNVTYNETYKKFVSREENGTVYYWALNSLNELYENSLSINNEPSSTNEDWKNDRNLIAQDFPDLMKDDKGNYKHTTEEEFKQFIRDQYATLISDDGISDDVFACISRVNNEC